MNLIAVIKRLSVKELFVLSTILLTHPFYILPTIQATKQTLLLCDRYFKNNHHKNGIGNAFRHALWNVLICRNTFVINESVKKSTAWAQKITDLHEKLAPNAPLENAMDLHNNKVGRLYFTQLKYNSLEETIIFLKAITDKAKKVFNLESVEKYTTDLVYISTKE